MDKLNGNGNLNSSCSTIQEILFYLKNPSISSSLKELIFEMYQSVGIDLNEYQNPNKQR